MRAAVPLASVIVALVLSAPLKAHSDAIDDANSVLAQVRQQSFPDLAGLRIRVKPFHSNNDFFRSRFELSSFFFRRRMHYLVEVNTEAWTLQAPESGIEAVAAHELSHIVYYQSSPRLKLIGLIRLISSRYMARFEHSTDTEAIVRGYGPGLIAYRKWLYLHVSPSVARRKKKFYMTPEQIQALLDRNLVPEKQD